MNDTNGQEISNYNFKAEYVIRIVKFVLKDNLKFTLLYAYNDM